MAVAGRRAVGVSFRLQAMEVSMCAICEGAQSLPEGEMPCEKELSRFGQILQQQLGEGPAFDLITQATGGVPSPSERTRDALGSLLHGIYSGRMKDQKREAKTRPTRNPICNRANHPWSGAWIRNCPALRLLQTSLRLSLKPNQLRWRSISAAYRKSEERNGRQVPHLYKARYCRPPSDP